MNTGMPTRSTSSTGSPADNLRLIKATLENTAAELGVPAPPIDIEEAKAAKATVIVVGEPKSGKSTLVNALVGRPGLSPVDYVVATATYIAVRYGTPAAFVYPEGATTPEEIHLAELAAWTSIEGLARNPRAPRSPRPVEVRIPAPLLEQVDLVDTPGVGGFDGTHDRATLTAVTGATTLFFCVDASRPISEPELRFLEQATESIADVTFVLTRVDQQAAWRDVLDANRAQVAARTPQFAMAPWFPVAAPLAEKALERALPAEAAQMLRERSGVDALTSHLSTDVAGRVQSLAAANVVKSMQSAFGDLRELAASRVELLQEAPEDASARLEPEQQQLEKLASLEDTWRTELEVHLSALRTSELHRVDRTIRAIEADAGGLARDVDVSPEAFAELVNADLEEESKGSAERLVEAMNNRIRSIVGDAVDSAGFRMALAAAERSDEVIQLREARDLVAEGRLQPAQRMPLLMSGSSGIFLTNMALTPLLGAWAWLPGVGVAIAATATAVLFARKQSLIAERQQWLQTRLSEARADLQTVIDQRITTAKVLTARAVREWLRMRQSELRASIKEITAHAARDRQSRDQSLREARARIGTIDKVVDSCEKYVQQLRSPVPSAMTVASATEGEVS